MDLNTVPLTPTLSFSHKLPPELCNQVIDALAGDKDPETRALPEDTRRALVNCALVCHNWRPRARRHLRQGIKIDDVNSLTGLAQRMRAASTVLSPHVRSLRLTLPERPSIPPSNVLTLLPMLFRLGISSIDEFHLSHPYRSSSQIQSEDTEQKTVSFPYLPLHPRFPSLVTPVLSTVRLLRMYNTTFHSFSDFGRFLNCFLGLEYLMLHDVRWLTRGIVPGCMTRKTRRTFLQNLRDLHVRTHHPVYTPHARAHTSRILASLYEHPWYQQDSRRSPRGQAVRFDPSISTG